MKHLQNKTRSHSQRKKAAEILVFLLSDTDQIHDPEKPNAIPVTYALKGYSLNTDTLRNMIDVVCDKCLEKDIKIICEAMDGQWSRLVVRSADGSSLTRIQYARMSGISTAKTAKLCYLKH